MTEIREAGTAYSRMTVPDQQVIAAAINMMLTVYAGLRIPQLEAPKNEPEPMKEENHNDDQ